MTSSFFAKADMLKRQGRTARARRQAEGGASSQFAAASSSPASHSNPLNIIVEEDENGASSSSSRSASPLFVAESRLKAKRRHANVSDIRIARPMPAHDQHDLFAAGPALTSPRPAPSPATSSSSSASATSSPDSFELTFQFPQPPTLKSPTADSIVGYYTCESPSSDGMPLTPSTSDDDEHTAARPAVQAVNPRRVSIHPLVINKHSQRILARSIEQQKEMVEEQAEEESTDDDAESDSEWYTREFSKIINPVAFPYHNQQQNTPGPARRDSLFVDADADATVRASSTKRESKALPPTPTRTSGIFIPSYPPPPVPSPRSTARESPVPSFSSDPSSTTSQNAIRRAPPRFSVPADFEFVMDGQDNLDADVEDDGSSVFSFSMYDIDLGDADFTRPAPPSLPLADLTPSPRSSYSQPSWKGSDELLDIRVGRIIGPDIPEEDEEEEDAFSDQDVAFEMDYCMMLPLSLPSTPMDLEADIAQGLEQLRSSDNEDEEPRFVQEDAEAMDTTTVEIAEVQAQPEPEQEVVVPTVRGDAYIDDVFSPISPCFSPPPTSLNSSFIPYYSLASPITDSYFPASPGAAQTHFTSLTPATNPTSGMDTEERVLKSKWSSSTLGSIREEHAHARRPSASSKLRLYFGGSGKRASGAAARSSKVPATPTSPFPSFMLSPRKASKTSPAPVSTASPLSPQHRTSFSFSSSPSSTPASTPSPKSSPSPPHAAYAYARAHPYSPSPSPGARHQRGVSSSEQVVGYGNNRPAGVRRRGSVSTISSDACTEVSASSTSSSGLRRKPIPVEMFLRA